LLAAAALPQTPPAEPFSILRDCPPNQKPWRQCVIDAEARAKATEQKQFAATREAMQDFLEYRAADFDQTTEPGSRAAKLVDSLDESERQWGEYLSSHCTAEGASAAFTSTQAYAEIACSIRLEQQRMAELTILQHELELQRRIEEGRVVE
jgi:hypothetical protein